MTAIAAVFSALTVLLLLVIARVWLQNYRDVRSPLALGLLAFCLVLAVENLVALYFYLTMAGGVFVDDPSITALVVLMRGLQFVAVAVFAYVSIR